MAVNERIVVNVTLDIGFFNADGLIGINTARKLFGLVIPDSFVHHRLRIREVHAEMFRHGFAELPNHRCKKVGFARSRCSHNRNEKTGRTQKGTRNLEMALGTCQLMARNSIGIQSGTVDIETTGQKPHLFDIAQQGIAKQIGRLADEQNLIRGKFMPTMGT